MNFMESCPRQMLYILRLICTNNLFSAGVPPRPRWGSAAPDLLAGFGGRKEGEERGNGRRGVNGIEKGRGGERKRGGKGIGKWRRKGERRGGKGKGNGKGKGKEWSFLLPPCFTDHAYGPE